MKYIITLSIILLFSLKAYSDDEPEINVINMEDYLENKLNYVTQVTANGNILTLYGYDSDDMFDTVNVSQERYNVLNIYDSYEIYSGISYLQLQLSLSAIPIKVRPSVDGFVTNATSGLTNTGLNIDLLNTSVSRYFSDGSNSTHKLSLGVLLAPSVEELDSTTTRGFLEGGNKTSQLFVSTAITINYSYNGITFSFVPAGWDFGTTTVGQNWVYNGQRWWGFGIGLETKLLEKLIE